MRGGAGGFYPDYCPFHPSAPEHTTATEELQFMDTDQPSGMVTEHDQRRIPPQQTTGHNYSGFIMVANLSIAFLFLVSISMGVFLLLHTTITYIVTKSIAKCFKCVQ